MKGKVLRQSLAILLALTSLILGACVVPPSRQENGATSSPVSVPPQSSVQPSQPLREDRRTPTALSSGSGSGTGSPQPEGGPGRSSTENSKKAEEAESHHQIALIYLSQKVYDKAIEHFEQALKLNPHHKGARKKLGEAIAGQKDLERKVNRTLGSIYKEKGMYEKAAESYQKVLEWELRKGLEKDDPKADRQSNPRNQEPTVSTISDDLKSVLLEKPPQRWLDRISSDYWRELGSYINDFLKTWLPLAGLLIFTVVLPVVAFLRWLCFRLKRQPPILINTFDGPDADFKTKVGKSMAEIAIDQLKQSGLQPGMERLEVAQETTMSLLAQLGIPEATRLAPVIRFLYPLLGVRIVAHVHKFGEDKKEKLGVTAKGVRLGFWPPRERLIASTTFWSPDSLPPSEIYPDLAKKVGYWAEHVVMTRELEED